MRARRSVTLQPSRIPKRAASLCAPPPHIPLAPLVTAAPRCSQSDPRWDELSAGVLSHSIGGQNEDVLVACCAAAYDLNEVFVAGVIQELEHCTGAPLEHTRGGGTRGRGGGRVWSGRWTNKKRDHHRPSRCSTSFRRRAREARQQAVSTRGGLTSSSATTRRVVNAARPSSLGCAAGARAASSRAASSGPAISDHARDGAASTLGGAAAGVEWRRCVSA